MQHNDDKMKTHIYTYVCMYIYIYVHHASIDVHTCLREMYTKKLNMPVVRLHTSGFALTGSLEDCNLLYRGPA